jgi:hypothetical protein
MNGDLYVINGKTYILSSLLNGNVPSVEGSSVAPEDFVEICEELFSEGFIKRTNFGNVISAEVTDKGMTYLDQITNMLPS